MDEPVNGSRHASQICLISGNLTGSSTFLVSASYQCRFHNVLVKKHSPLLPKLKSASFRLIASDLKLSTRNAVVPPEVQHLQLTMGILSTQFTTKMLQPLMPIIRKVKHLGWYCCVFRRNDMGAISCRLDSLKNCESMEEIKWYFWTFPSDIMPPLERSIDHITHPAIPLNSKRFTET